MWESRQKKFVGTSSAGGLCAVEILESGSEAFDSWCAKQLDGRYARQFLRQASSGLLISMSHAAFVAVNQTPTLDNAHRLIVVIRYTTKSILR